MSIILKSNQTCFTVAMLALALGSATYFASGAAEKPPRATDNPDYNIFFVILDDVGADQLNISNPAGTALASTPTINAIAAQGVNFSNCWSMPECSPSRVCFFTGRYPSHTRVLTALTPSTLAQSQCSPYETTTPIILGADGYHSKLLGKFHLSQEWYNPAGIGAPASNGFAEFNGTLMGAPPPLDPTIANQVDSTKVVYSCGFPVNGSAPAICACAFPDGHCVPGVDALECLAAGGMPLVASDGTPILECSAEAAARISWQSRNGSYAWPRTINSEGVAWQQDLPVRKYSNYAMADDAIEFMKEQRSQPGSKWMCTLSFTGDHDPFQPPAPSLVPGGTGWPNNVEMACGVQPDLPNAIVQERLISNLVIEALDAQIRRVLLETGLATLGADGAFALDAPDTLIVIVGDNGSYFKTVQAPFNSQRPKGTVYQTGVSVPLVAAGGPTVAPGRRCDKMVNIIDLFELWGECANVNVHEAVPVGRILNSQPMMRYLTSADAPSAREWNFTEVGPEYTADVMYPCLFSQGGADSCSDAVFATQPFCEAQGGVWYGPGTTHPPVMADCCDLWNELGQPANFTFVYPVQQALTDGRYKLIYNQQPPCLEKIGATEYEFYDLWNCYEAAQLYGRGIDNPEYNLLREGTTMTELQQFHYDRLRIKLAQIQATLPVCVGDITLNGVVDGADLGAMLNYWGGSSVADHNNDGLTNGADLAILLNAWGECPGPAGN